LSSSAANTGGGTSNKQGVGALSAAGSAEKEVDTAGIVRQPIPTWAGQLVNALVVGLCYYIASAFATVLLYRAYRTVYPLSARTNSWPRRRKDRGGYASIGVDLPDPAGGAALGAPLAKSAAGVADGGMIETREGGADVGKEVW
jgi:hypothetical protein